VRGSYGRSALNRSINCARPSVKVLGAHHISPFDLDDEELDREILAGTQLGCT
jgi:hypothetical protein